MKIMILTSSPNSDGLTAACGLAAATGAKDTVLVDLNRMIIETCRSCGNGWGICRNEHTCVIKDDFQRIHSDMKEVDAFVFITPVYWGEMSESMKAFTDRIRRCEAWLKEENLFHKKPVICVAAAGGSGNGTISCLASMERFVMHVGADKFDFISITQKTREHKLAAITASVMTMVHAYQ